LAKGKILKKKNKANNRSKNEYSREIWAVVFFASGLLAFFSFLDKTGPLGQYLIKPIFFGIFGQIASCILLFGLFLTAWRLIRGYEFKGSMLRTNILYGLFILVVSALVHTIFVNTYADTGFFGSIPKLFLSYTEGNVLTGGLIGGGISTLCQKFMYKPGTLTVLIAATVILSMILFSFSIVKISKKIKIIYDYLFDKAVKLKKSFEESASNPAADTEDVIKAVLTSSELLKLKEPYVEELDNPDLLYNISGIKKVVEGNEKINPLKIQSERHNDSQYIFPPFSMLKNNPFEDVNPAEQKAYVAKEAKKLEEVLRSFGIEAKVINISRGPSVTRYELHPSAGVKVSRIKNLADDIALNLAAPGIRIEAPIPGKAAIGIEIPNKEVMTVYLRDVIESNEFIKHPSKLAFCLGRDITGENIVADISKMPHLMVAGSTGSGKSVCINCLIMSLIYKSSPDDVRLILIDPKVVELGVYNGVPHLLIPVVTDPRKAAGALAWAVQEMTNRYNLFASNGARDLNSYNVFAEKQKIDKLPHIVIIIDELADLMMVAHDTVEDSICRLAQMARAAGMHLVLATQRPSVDVITGIIKANIPSRISFKVASQIDSRTIMDNGGAEKLLGRGDMLFLPVGSMKPLRVQGAFVCEAEIEQVVEFVKQHRETQYDNAVIEEVNTSVIINGSTAPKSTEGDELLPQAIEIAVELRQISASYLQRKLGIGYNRSARIIDHMEERGIIGGKDGSNPRQVLIDKYQLQEMKKVD